MTADNNNKPTLEDLILRALSPSQPTTEGQVISFLGTSEYTEEEIKKCLRRLHANNDIRWVFMQGWCKEGRPVMTRTANDLRERGYKLVCLGRPYAPYTGNARQWRRDNPPGYKVVKLDAKPEDRWAGMVSGPAPRSTAHVPGGEWMKRLGRSTYPSRVAAAHAIIDYLEENQS